MILPLTKIGFFNPGRLTDEEIEQSFIARVSLFQFIFKKIVSEKAVSIPQHHLLIGQRGMGKTSLLIRMAAELRKVPYKDSFIPLSFPEEQYNIDRLSKFWLNCLDALADALDKEGKTTELNALDTEIRNLSKQTALDANAVYNTFKKWVDKTGRRPVLLVDNLNLIFSKISKEEQHQLRATLMSKGAPILVGASAAPIEETLEYSAPFYDAFQINYLKKLSFSESMDVLTNLAKITGNPDFANNLYRQKGKVNALYDLTGGTPRTLAILFPLIQNGFSEDIQTDLDALLDVVTPLYKARFEELSQQLQVVLDAAALNWDPITIEQLREKTLLENQQLSPQLKRLVDVGWLQKLNAYEAKGGAYEVSERFFNIWYLMRRSSRRQKRELYCLTKFLETFYGNDLQNIARSRLNCTIENINQVALHLALADAINEEELSQKLRNKSYEALLDLSNNNEEILKSFSLPKYIADKKVSNLINESENKFKEKNYVLVESLLQKILEIDANNEYAWARLGNLYMEPLSRYKEAEHMFLRAININEKSLYAWLGLGRLYMTHLQNYKSAEIVIKKFLAIDKKSAYSWTMLGKLYMESFGKYKDAEKALRKAIEIDNRYDYAWYSLGVLYTNHLQKYLRAEDAFMKAIAIDQENALVWNSLGLLYVDKLAKLDKAEQAFKNAITLDEDYTMARINLASLYMSHLDRYSDAEDIFQRVITADAKNTLAWNGLAFLYMDYLGRYIEAEEAFKRAISLNNESLLDWLGLTKLYLIQKKYQEVIVPLKELIRLEKNNSNYWDILGFVSHNIHDYKSAEYAYLKALDINPDLIDAKYTLISLWRDNMNKVQEAKELFDTIVVTENLKGTHLLNQSLFAYYDKNIGIAENFLKEALLSIGDSLPLDTTDDWYRSAGVIIKLGYAESLLNVFRENGYDTIFRPFYVAIEALTKKEDELFFNSVAAEVREPAKKIMAMIKNHIN